MKWGMFNVVVYTGVTVFFSLWVVMHCLNGSVSDVYIYVCSRDVLSPMIHEDSQQHVAIHYV